MASVGGTLGFGGELSRSIHRGRPPGQSYSSHVLVGRARPGIFYFGRLMGAQRVVRIDAIDNVEQGVEGPSRD